METAPAHYDFIAADITNTCNLRCQFCINDFSTTTSKSPAMHEHTYRKMLTLLPLVPDDRFLISCLWEPILHRDFLRFLELIPEHLRKKVFFTTNLTTAIPDDFFTRLSRIRLSHINISLDSLNPRVFESLRKGAKFERFERNLDRLVEAFSQSKVAPPVHYVSMALKPNMDGLPSLVEKTIQRYLSTFNEVRCVFEVPHLSSEWKRGNLPSNEDWDRFLSMKWPSSCVVSGPPGVYFPNDNEPYSRNFAGSSPVNLPFALFISSSGDIQLEFGDFHANINELADPKQYFIDHKKRLQAALRRKWPGSTQTKEPERIAHGESVMESRRMSRILPVGTIRRKIAKASYQLLFGSR